MGDPFCFGFNYVLSRFYLRGIPNPVSVLSSWKDKQMGFE